MGTPHLAPPFPSPASELEGWKGEGELGWPGAGRGTWSARYQFSASYLIPALPSKAWKREELSQDTAQMLRDKGRGLWKERVKAPHLLQPTPPLLQALLGSKVWSLLSGQKYHPHYLIQ